MTEIIVSSLISGGAGIFGAVLGAIVGGRLTQQTVERTSRELEKSEIRRARVKCVIALAALRWVPGNTAAPDDAMSELLSESNKALILWADDQIVTNCVRDLYFALSQRRPADEYFKDLIKHACNAAQLPVAGLSDADFMAVFQMKMRGA